MKRQDYYKDNYERDDNSGLLTRRLETVLNIMSQKSGRILDIGCGTGGFSNRIGARYGIDISEEAVKIARTRGLEAFQVDIGNNAMPFEDDYFDSVFCGETIEHIFDTDYMLSEIGRVLRSKGVLIITTPNLASWFNRLVLLFGFQPYYTDVSLKYQVGKIIPIGIGGSGHIHVFTYKALRELLKKHNFSIDHMIGSQHHESKKVPKAFDYVDRLFSRYVPLSSGIIVIARNDK